MQSYDVIILGAGAAGLMCAAGATRRGKRVLVLEKAKKPGEKILISGGGRCNFTNLHTTPANFLSDNPRFCISALKRYSPKDFIALVERYGIAYHEKKLGQLFCDDTARDIVSMLVSEAGDTTIQTETITTAIERREESGSPDSEAPRQTFLVETDNGSFEAPSLVVATGGPSIPQMGATRFAYTIADYFGVPIITPRPGLVPLVFGPDTMAQLNGLSGVSLDARASLGKARFDEALLFTHRGFSGPVILQISSYWQEGDQLTIDLLPGQDVFAMLKDAKRDHPRKELQTVLSEVLPRTLALRLTEIAGATGRMAELPDKLLARIGQQINQWQVTPQGSQGLRKAEVTLGGVDTRALSSKTMEVNKTPGLYFIGEAVDVTGHLGGFNFQWAWASGHACGQAV